MSIFGINDAIGDIKRFRFIVGVLFEEGFAFFVNKARLSWAVPIECQIRCFLKSCVGMRSSKESAEDFPIRFKRVLIKLGPTFVKFGQVLSLRSDILPPELTQELSKLTNQVPTFSYEEVRKAIEKDLGKPIEKIFKNFESKPFAAASLAQVHKATLPNGTKVAVKVQRPGIRYIIEKDVHIMAFLAKIIEDKIPESRIYRPTQVVREFAETIARELDFTVEATHAKRFAVMFENDKTIKVARVFRDFSAKNVLTMELIEGVRLDDEEALKKAEINKKVLAQNGINALLKQVFVEGFFHADPHPGNYFALPNSVFAFIDYGMVGRLTEKDRKELASFFISFINEDSESAIKHLLHIVETSTASNLGSFEHDVDDILHEWYGAKLKDISLAKTFYRIIESGRKNLIYFPSTYAFLGKSLLTIESMGFMLDPEFDFAKQMAPFVRKIIGEELKPEKLRKKIEDQSLDYYSYLETFPEMTMKLLQKLDSGEIGVKIDQSEIDEFGKRMSREATIKIVVNLFASILIVVGIVYALENKFFNFHFSVSNLGIIVLLSAVFVILIRRR